MSLRRVALLGLAALTLSAASASAKETYLVIIGGLGGEERYREKFHDWSMQMRTAAIERNGVAEDNVYYLAEKPEMAPEDIHSKSTKENVSALFVELSSAVRPGDQVYVLLIGHGSFRSEESRFNLPGPDLTAAEFDVLLEAFAEQEVVFVNTSSASGAFVQALSGGNRIVVTATKSGYERNESQFGQYFVEAYAGDGADTDKNERISVLEAFTHARVKVDGFYNEENILKTEHALLDDNGDGEGVHDPGESEGDRASVTYLRGVPGAAEGLAGADGAIDPELRPLIEKRDALEARVVALRLQKDSMPEELYLDELETLLVELAEVTQKIEERAP